MKRIFVTMAIFAASLLAGCEHKLTLEEARALCSQQGGFLVVIHSQKITRAGLGKEIDSPGDCVAAGQFKDAPPAVAPTNQLSPSP